MEVINITENNKKYRQFCQMIDKMQQFWDQRYAANDTVFGTKANKFFKLFIDLHKPGAILLPAEGEGRNAVYAAQKGWQVDAFDFSEVAREKALDLARGEKVVINYELKNITDFKATIQYDAVGLIYVHLPEKLRKLFHAEIYNSIKPGGFLVLEAFAKEQAELGTGGPKNLDLLYDAPSLCNDFQFLHILNCEQKELVLEEGEYHKGKSAVLRLIGQRL
jgi:SAM-dependent methyltransferase